MIENIMAHDRRGSLSFPALAPPANLISVVIKENNSRTEEGKLRDIHFVFTVYREIYTSGAVRAGIPRLEMFTIGRD